jgi:hypothetical protein
MLERGVRWCDICRAEIPAGAVYRKAKLPQETALALVDPDDPGLAVTWTCGQDGRIELDICCTCTLSMGALGAAAPHH